MEKKAVRHNFIQGAIILTIGMLIVKMVGAFFKLPLGSIISENGMGYFNTAYNFYAVFFSLATAGFPVAIAKLVAESYSLKKFNDIKTIKKVAFPVFFISGLIACLIMIVGAGAYTNFIGNSGAYLPIVVLSPTILFCCLNSVYRGYYEGLGNMYPTAVSEIIEAILKLVIGLSAAYFAVNFLSEEFYAFGTILGIKADYDSAVLQIYSVSAASAILGVTIGSFFSYIYLVLYYKRKGVGISPKKFSEAPKSKSRKSIAKKLISMAVPIAAGSLALSVSGLVDQTFLQRRLTDLIFSETDTILSIYKAIVPAENLSDISTISNFLFGCYGYALTIFMLVPALTQGFAISALPSLTSSWVKKNSDDIKENMQSMIRITALVGLPAGLGISVLSRPIIDLLYAETVGAPIISEMLTVLGLAAVFASLAAPLSAMLQAVGRVDLPVKILIVGLIIKIALNFYLCGIPEINVKGAAIGTLACYVFIVITQLIALVKVSKIKINILKTLIKPLFCAVLCALSAFYSERIFSEVLENKSISCLLAILIAVIVYIFLLLVSRTLYRHDIIMLPNGENFIKVLEKKGWIG